VIFLGFINNYICILDFSITFFELLPLNFITSDVTLEEPPGSTETPCVLNLCPNYSGVANAVFANMQLITFFGSLECSIKTIQISIFGLFPRIVLITSRVL
jgi:hypothetical protein